MAWITLSVMQVCRGTLSIYLLPACPEGAAVIPTVRYECNSARTEGMPQNTGNLFTCSRCNRNILTTRRRAVVLIAALAAPIGFNTRDMVV